MFEHNLRLLFPQLDSLPHSDTLFRLLCRIDVGQIEQAHIALVNQLIRNKKFTRYLINNCYPIGIDGTQKIAFSALWDEHLLQRRTGPKVDPDSDDRLYEALKRRARDQALGRRRRHRFTLTTNYRNSAEIFAVSAAEIRRA